MANYDFKRVERALYFPPTTFTRVTVPPQWFLAIDGSGDPNVSDEYRAAVEALYGASYAVKFATRGDDDAQDYTVGPLEGLWWSEDVTRFEFVAKSEWHWTMLIRQPDWLSTERVREVLEETARKKDRPLIAALRHERIEEGDCVQIMHIGPYDDEAPTLARLHREYLPGHQLVENGHHHEIYLGDPRRVDPAKLKTVLRQPVRPA